jgi:SNF2 family DNA or RNA helicase
VIAIQLGFLNDQLRLWAETSERSPSTRPRTTKASSKATAHPFAIDGKTIRTILGDLLPTSSSKKESAIAWLPSINGIPVPSHPLIGEPPESEAKIEMHPWAIPILSLTTSEAIDFLAESLDREILKPGVLIGSTMKYWSIVHRYAGALLAREQFLPGIDVRGKLYRACWNPVISGNERVRFQRLVDTFPSAARALSDTETHPPTQTPSAILMQLLKGIVDHLVRSSLTKLSAPKLDSVHDHWLAALRTSDGKLNLSEKELNPLIQSLEDWQRPIAVADTSGYRLSFRLEEPSGKNRTSSTGNSGTWTVRYLLQAHDDPSLLVPLKDVWQPKGRSSSRRLSLPSREFLLTSLGQAGKICPEVEASLKTSVPSEFLLDSSGAHRFLTENAWVLEQAGFGVLLPSWWARTGSRQRLTLTANAKSSKKSSSSSGVMSLEELVKFDWKVALGEVELTIEELETLAKLKSPLVQVRGQWVQVNAEEIQAAIDFWKTHPQTEGTVRDLIQLSIGASNAPNGMVVSRVKAGGQLKKFLDQLQDHGKWTEISPPKTFQGTLRPYQVRGYSWLHFLRRCGLGSCLADDMGLGKSIQTLAMILQAREEGETRPILLICPTSVVGHWRKESERFAPTLSVLIHHGSERLRGNAFLDQIKSYGLVVSSYSLLYRDLETLQSVHWGGVILDEAQNIKNPNAKTSQAARELKADSRLALTGTPVENHLGDLWSISQFLNPGFLGNRESFKRNFLIPIQMEQDEEATERLKKLTGPFLLRRMKTDKSIISDLPDKVEMKVFSTLTKEQASLYAAVVKDLDKSLSEEEGFRRKGLILGAMSKLKQICNHPAQFLKDNSSIADRSGKLTRLTEMIEEILEVNERSLIFTQFTEMGDIIQKYLQETFGREVLFLHGGVAQKNRERMIARFQDPSKESPPIFLISLKAGGSGLTLTAANHVFHFDRWWNPAVENQATDRAFRIGQTRNVQVHKFVCIGTMEEKIDEMIERKKDLAGRVVGSGENWLTELSNNELKDLLALRPEAVEE